jgi:exopolyphosphatase/guanosine-5'-triphosphate,3'-diphosphate pyrophosphatase
MKGQVLNSLDLAMVMAFRLSALFHRSRTDVGLPALEAHCDARRFRIGLDPRWLMANPLTSTALQEEVKEWKQLGVVLDIEALEEIVVMDEESISAPS